MNILKLTLLSLLLLPGLVLQADPLAEALPILQAKYVDFNALHYRQGDRLGDLIARSDGKIFLSAPEAAAAPVPIITATLPDNILYWRLASFTPEKNWLDLGTRLEQENGNAAGIILDLRSNVAPDDIAGAAQVVTYFMPGDDILLKFLPLMSDEKKIGHPVILDHPFHGPVIVLINDQTTGAAEVLAARLKADGALLVGRESSGKGAVMEEQKLSSGNVLRYVAAHVYQPDGTPLWGHPVVPDIALTVDDQTERAALALIKDNQILDVIEESPERHRLSEASLVQGQDPEWDDYLASLERKPVLLSLPVIHDTVLISALDSLKAIRLSERSVPPQSQANASLPASTSLQ
jgi:hypothetical protein